MDQERLNTEGAPPVPDGVGPDWAMFIQQQIQNVFQAAIPHMVQQIFWASNSSSFYTAAWWRNRGVNSQHVSRGIPPRQGTQGGETG